MGAPLKKRATSLRSKIHNPGGRKIVQNHIARLDLDLKINENNDISGRVIIGESFQNDFSPISIRFLSSSFIKPGTEIQLKTTNPSAPYEIIEGKARVTWCQNNNTEGRTSIISNKTFSYWVEAVVLKESKEIEGNENIDDFTGKLYRGFLGKGSN